MGLFDNIKGFFQSVGNTIGFGKEGWAGKGVQFITSGFNSAGKTLTDVATTLHQDARDLIRGGGNLVSGVVTGGQNLLGRAVDTAGNVANKAGDTLGGIASSLALPLIGIAVVGGIFLLRNPPPAARVAGF
jgi:hypothetical protein